MKLKKTNQDTTIFIPKNSKNTNFSDENRKKYRN